MGVIGFGLAILAALGFESLRKLLREGKTRKLVKPALAVSTILGVMWLWTFVSTNSNVWVTRRNLIFPSGILLSFILIFLKSLRATRQLAGSVVISTGLPRRPDLIGTPRNDGRGYKLFSVFCFLFIALDLFRFHHKFTPYMDISMWYPRLPVLAELGNRPGRSFGLLDGNLNLPFRIYSVDGYDPLVSSQYVRMTYPAEELGKRNRITGPYLPKGEAATIDLISGLGVKWAVDSATPGGAQWDLKLWEYGDQFQVAWKDVKYQILYNSRATSELVEPLWWMRSRQSRLFLLGLGVSGMTMITLGLTRRLWR
jgi:hypothetical protein